MKRSILFFASILFVVFAFAQNCEKMLAFKQGTSVTYKNYDAKKQLLGSHKQTFVKVASEGEKVVSTVKGEYFDKNGASQSASEFTIKCAKGILQMDMSKMMPSGGSSPMMKGMEIKIKGDDLEYPSTFTVGQTLKDGKMQMEMGNAGTVFATTDFEIVSRKVEAKESVTTLAGVFECYKISQVYNSDTKMAMLGKSMKTTGKTVQWFSLDVGMVKSENYKEDGTLAGITMLEEIKK